MTMATTSSVRLILSGDVIEALDETLAEDRRYATRDHLVECLLAEALGLDDDEDDDEDDEEDE